MKKMLTIIAVLISTFLFAQVPVGWNWNLNDEAKLKEIDSSTSNNYSSKRIKVLLALVGKNDSNITYTEFKSIINNALKSYDKNIKNFQIQLIIAQIALNVKRFYSFNKEIINEFKNSYYVINFTACKYLNPEEFRKYYFTEKRIINATNLSGIFKQYQKVSLNYKKNEVKSDMELLKRIVYPKIGQGDKWKQLAVQIELILKSVE